MLKFIKSVLNKEIIKTHVPFQRITFKHFLIHCTEFGETI